MQITEHQQSAEITRLLVSQKTVFNVEDLSIYTGLSKSAIYKLTAARKLRHSCPNGKILYFQKTDVDNYLMSNPVQPIDDINQEVINYSAKTSLRGGQGW